MSSSMDGFAVSALSVSQRTDTASLAQGFNSLENRRMAVMEKDLGGMRSKVAEIRFAEHF